MCGQFSLPAPLPLFLLHPTLFPPHPPPNLAPHSSHTTTNPTPRIIDVLSHYKSLPFNPPLRPCILDPPHRLHWPTSPTPLHLIITIRMPCRACKDLANFLHTDVCGKSRHIGVVYGRIAGRVIVFVFREGAPHAAVDAVSQSWHIGNGRAFRGGGERGEDEFRRGKFGEVLFESGLPRGGRGSEVGGCAGHGAEEGAETEDDGGSYGC